MELHLETRYKIAVKFLKENEGKIFYLKYDEKNILSALKMIVKKGCYDPNLLPEIGFFDVVGHDRIKSWQKLGNLTREQAQIKFIDLIQSRCNIFQAVVDAHIFELVSNGGIEASVNVPSLNVVSEKPISNHITSPRRLSASEILDSNGNDSFSSKFEELKIQQEYFRVQISRQEQDIKHALRQQTADQFRSYAEEHFPNDSVRQNDLVEQLHNQHYLQYMNQLYQQQHQMQQFLQKKSEKNYQLRDSDIHAETCDPNDCNTDPTNNLQKSLIHNCNLNFDTTLHNISSTVVDPLKSQQSIPSKENQEFEENSCANESTNLLSSSLIEVSSPNKPMGIWDGHKLHQISSASMWTRANMSEFRESLKSDKDSQLVIGSGEIVTVRVPTHIDGSCLFWEFSTDQYDIGFGLFFEWTAFPESSESNGSPTSITNPTSLPENEDALNSLSIIKSDSPGSVHEIEIIPVIRRNCVHEVFCGCHPYPCKGVYLLKFNNSYSLWRSKTLYYRVYYSK